MRVASCVENTVAHPAAADRSATLASAPNPKFAHSCRESDCELRNRDTSDVSGLANHCRKNSVRQRLHHASVRMRTSRRMSCGARAVTLVTHISRKTQSGRLNINFLCSIQVPIISQPTSNGTRPPRLRCPSGTRWDDKQEDTEWW